VKRTLNRPRKIIYITGLLAAGGAERQLLKLARGLQAEGHHMKVISLGANEKEYYADILRNMGIEVLHVPPRNRVFRAMRIRGMIGASGSDIIQAFHFYANGYAVIAAWNREIPVVGGMRKLPISNHINKVPALWRYVCSYGVDRFVCNSRPAK
jgi:hypothetical protein